MRGEKKSEEEKKGKEEFPTLIKIIFLRRSRISGHKKEKGGKKERNVLQRLIKRQRGSEKKGGEKGMTRPSWRAKTARASAWRGGG